MKIPAISRRSFLKSTSVLAGSAPLLASRLAGQSAEAKGPLMAYVGTFSSPLRDMLPTQVDLPAGNGRGIHLFQVNRTTGGLTFTGHYTPVGNPSIFVFLDLAKSEQAFSRERAETFSKSGLFFGHG